MLRKLFTSCFFLGAILLAPGQAAAQSVQEETGERVSTSAAAGKQDAGVDAPQVAGRIIEQTNAFRREEGRQPVRSDLRLMKTAQYFADYMARTDEYGHQADGSRPADRVKKFGYDHCIVLENIAYQYSSAGFSGEELTRGFVEGWKESKGHRRNMLDPDVTETGVAVARSEKSGYWYAVQMFGRPKSESIRIRITNDTDTTVHYQMADRSFTLEPDYIRTHRECRPPEVTFRTGKGDSARTIAARQVKEDARLVIRREDGELRVEEE